MQYDIATLYELITVLVIFSDALILDFDLLELVIVVLLASTLLIVVSLVTHVDVFMSLELMYSTGE